MDEKFGIKVDIIVEVETDLSTDEFIDMLLGWVESNNWYMTGGIYPVDEEGNRIKEL